MDAVEEEAWEQDQEEWAVPKLQVREANVSVQIAGILKLTKLACLACKKAVQNAAQK